MLIDYIICYLSFSLWLASLSMIISSSGMLLQIVFFLLFNSWVMFHCVYICVFLIHSSADGHQGCFHVLAIVNRAAVNTGMHVYFWTMLFSGCSPGLGLLGHMVALHLLFKEISILFSTVAVSIYIPTKNARVFLFLHTLSSIYCW